MGFESPSLKGRALRLLTRREHSRVELERKLARFEEVPGTLAQALDELQAAGFIDQSRVIESVLHQRAARFGEARLRQVLAQRGVQADDAADALASLRESEPQRAREVWRRRFAEPPRDAAERGRQARFLMSRGFSAEVVSRVLRSASADEASEL
jgi:regulatory protein